MTQNIVFMSDNNRGETDIFDKMAGGRYYMETFAGGSLYSGLIIPQTNPQSILKQYAFSKTAMLVGLQEDFVEFALMPLQMDDFLSDQEIRVMTLTILAGINTYSIHVNGRGYTDVMGNVTSVNNNSFMVALRQELTQDTALEDVAEMVGYNAYGIIGATIAGSLVGMIMGGSANVGANLAERSISMFSGFITRSAVTGVTSALGITSTMEMMVVGSILGLVVSQAISVALGLKSGFGFGGNLVGQDGFDQHVDKFGLIDGVNTSVHTQYSAQETVTTGLLRMFSSITDALGMTYGGGISIDNSNDPDGLAGAGHMGRGSVDPTGRTSNETNQRGNNPIADAHSTNDGGNSDSDGGIGEGESGDGGLGAIGRGGYGVGGVADGRGGTGGTGGEGRHCCTVMVQNKFWRKQRLIELGEWDKKQNIIWRKGYQIGGKMVAKFFNKPNRLSYYGKMMDAFYDTHILKKSRTIYTWQAYAYIYPMVYITGVYAISKEYISRGCK